MLVLLVTMLHHTGKLSERQAREALGMTRRDFEELLPASASQSSSPAGRIYRLNEEREIASDSVPYSHTITHPGRPGGA